MPRTQHRAYHCSKGMHCMNEMTRESIALPESSIYMYLRFCTDQPPYIFTPSAFGGDSP